MSATQYGSLPETSKISNSDSPEQFISLLDVLAALWARKWLILVAAVVAAMGAGVTSTLIEKTYEASVVVSVVSDDTNASGLGAFGALASQFGGLASLMTSGNNRKAESIAILQSEGLTTAFIEKNNLLPVLYAQKWDSATNRWKTPQNAPTLWMAARFFKTDVRRTSTDLKTGLLTLTISWRNPAVSAQWANGIVAMANDYIRTKAISDGERNVSYLNEQLAQTNVVAVQNSISSLLESEIKKIMLARGSQEYAFKIIDAATVPERPSSPKPIIWAIIGCIVGILLSVLLILVRSPTLRSVALD